MTASAATLFRPAIWAGLTVYVAFLLTQAANAQDAGPGLGPDRSAAGGALGLNESGSDALEDDRSTPAALPPVPPPPGTPTAYGPLPPPAPPFRDTVFGAHANAGPPGGPSFLHPNFPEYQTRYGIWYQPRSFWEPTREVYRPQPFRPRGWGNLFVDDPCRHDRMDYNRYVVKDLPSRYGPSYYPLYQPPSECVIFRPEREYHPPVHGSAE
jgi:hypothetical protein